MADPGADFEFDQPPHPYVPPPGDPDPAANGAQSDDNRPIFQDAYDFINEEIDPPEPLWGTERLTILASAGLGLFAGRPGVGKTTFLIDLLCHLAAGRSYPPASDASNGHAPAAIHVQRPLRIGLIENEGPREMFRQKLKDKLDVFPHDIRGAGGYIGIQTWQWGAFSFGDNRALVKARDEAQQLQLDLIVGDPLTMLGIRGVGSPEDTREFVNRLKFMGLGLDLAFLLVHHFRERFDRQEDELARLSGAWGGHLDTLITLAAMGQQDQARLAFPKIRWAREERPKPIVLGRVFNMQSFEALGEEDDFTILEPALSEALQEIRDAHGGRKALGWVTVNQLAAHTSKRRNDVRKCLEGAPHLFALRTGEDARELEAPKTSKLWGLRSWDDAPAIPAAAPNPEPEPQHELFGGGLD